jgi:hypothetical protein
VYWKTHGKTFSEFLGARQNLLGIRCLKGSGAPEKPAKLIQKSGKTFSESAQTIKLVTRQLSWSLDY